MTSPELAPDSQPRVFMSYTWENEAHKDWVRRLAERLLSNGVDVILDQWDARLGNDLAHFMEAGVTGADRIVVVSSDNYIVKANGGKAGVGYEKKIMTTDLVKDAMSSRIVPVLRQVSGDKVVPTFLGSSKYVDFRDDGKWDASYRELLYDLYGRSLIPKPALGSNPFAAGTSAAAGQKIKFDSTKYTFAAWEGDAIVEYENNSGVFVLGSGVHSFTIHTSTAGHGGIYFMNDAPDISTVALARETSLERVQGPDAYDGSSRVRMAQIGDSVVVVNTSGRVAALEIQEVTIRATSPDGEPRLKFRYRIDNSL
ncbi:toll/interleukin-1 receptor domain-containing protein [Pseudoclavibacter sp. Z016]|uniref:toll/interleukin-1 receptor domain-containing protein n=1 Tax=Pseudoclavibacter sp. Z016 TaxID=2080581 RepID=UPI000CE7F67B|nr:toll/interleukin-1 receptor domain-containing protein [Pseudoclavibacter sp. Z016]PPF73380.1 hypothetical protein C5B99_15520 [Pseudoclavibacter sp. Z016]